MLTGCVQGEFFPQVNAATARVLAMEGCDVVIPPSQGCCGALSLHSGQEEQARGSPGGRSPTFERAGVDTMVVNAAGCGSTMKDYAEILEGDPARPDGRGRSGPSTWRSFWPSSARWPNGIRCRSPWPTTTPATWPTRRGYGPSPGSCWPPSPVWS